MIVEDVDGNFVAEYSSIKKAAEAYGCSSSTMIYRIAVGRIIDGTIFKVIEPLEDRPSFLKDYNKKPCYDNELNGDKFNIIDYETKNGICITPCPHKDWIYPRPMVASGKCVTCPSYKGKNKTNHQVACSYGRKIKTA